LPYEYILTVSTCFVQSIIVVIDRYEL
jgi:hypothetical protein